MSTHTPLAFTLLAFALGESVIASEHNLEFRLIVKPIDAKTFDAPNIEGQTIFVMKAHGVAYFKDGRVASKEFIFSSDQNKGAGPFYGYSTYQFEDGSTIVARFAGTDRPGQMTHGDYTVLSGTGVYAGAKGTGSFDAVKHQLKGANLLNGKFTITTP